MRDYTKIKAWQLSDELAVSVYKLSANFPSDERYAFTSQIRRAAYSVPANIAEGAGRRTSRDFTHFLHMALGSANEVHYFCHLAMRLNYLTKKDGAILMEHVSDVQKCLAAYIRAVETTI